MAGGGESNGNICEMAIIFNAGARGSEASPIPASPKHLRSLQARCISDPCKSDASPIPASPMHLRSLQVRCISDPCKPDASPIPASPMHLRSLQARCISELCTGDACVAPTSAEKLSGAAVVPPITVGATHASPVQRLHRLISRQATRQNDKVTRFRTAGWIA